MMRYSEKKPLAVSLVALVASLPSVGALFSRSFEGFRYDWGTAGLCVFSLAISVFAVVNLIRAENRGYSSTRIGLSVTALFFAFVPEIGLAMALIRDCGRT